MNFFRIFEIFLWKNVLYLRYKLWELITIFSMCLLIFFLYLYSSYKVSTESEFSPEVKDTRTLIVDYFGVEHLMYSPSTDDRIENIMESVRTEFEISLETVKAFNTTEEMIFYLEQNCRGSCFAVSFDPWPKNGNSLSYNISSNTMRISSRKRYVNDEDITTKKDNDDYIRTGFLSLQHVIDKCYMKSLSNQADYELNIGAMPIKVFEGLDSQRVIMFGSLYSILLNVLLLSTFLVPLVEEKQNGIKEFLCVATPLHFLNGLAFFLLRFILYIVFLIVGILVAVFYPAIGTVPITYICMLMILFKLSAMSYTYLLSVCFNSVFYAKVGGLLLLIIPYTFRFEKSAISTIASIFLSSKTFMDGIEIFQVFTNKHRTFHLSDVTTNITDWSYSILSIYLMLIFQCVFYSFLYNYLSCVFPGPGGLKKPFLFFLKPSYYKKRQRNEYTTTERGSDAIIIQDLVKTFKVPKRVIHIADRLNMVIKSKQITVLLGHNGVGKTTTMNMIMGSVPKDSGKIIVCSERDVGSYRHLIGFCPQHSVFMDYMTCGQHLRFFAKLRGDDGKEANRLTKKLLNQLKLEDKEDVYGRQLSGGMKRRLSLGIALAGETKVVILDEPSSGLDIESRRELWDILLELRKTKTVLVTTHHMEEAEVLGDTICILSNGRLQRTGSPLELKRKVGSGYILKICTKCGEYKEQETLNLIQQYIPGAKVLNIVPPTLHVSLPYESKQNYENMLSNLENLRDQLGIESISVTDTSLEDVFLNCAADVDQVDGPNLQHTESTRIPYEPLSPSTNISFCQQYCAIFYKKFIFLRSEWKFTLLMLTLPLLSALLAIVLMHSTAYFEVENALPLNLNIVKEGRIYMRLPAEKTPLMNKVDDILRKNIANHGIKVENLEKNFGVSIVEEILQLQEIDLADFLQNVIGVIELTKDEVTEELKIVVFFSANIYHSSVVLTNLVDNAILKATTLQTDSIETKYAPVRRFVTDVSPTRLEYYAVIVPIGIFFYLFYYVSLPFRERESGFKNLQAVPVLRFWFSTFSFDLLQHFLVCLLLYILQIFIMPQALYNRTELVTITLSIFVYGISYLPILYIFANSFRSISAISTYLLSMLIVSAIIPLITSGSVNAMKTYDTTITFMRLLPDFNINHQLRIINEMFVLERQNKLSKRPITNSVIRQTEELLNTDIILFYAVSVFIVAGTIFVYIIENKVKCQEISEWFSCYKCRGQVDGKKDASEEEERLVISEKEKIKEIVEDKAESNYPLLVRNLFKFYDRKAVVYDLNFAVEKQECFGLLGVNGAGKTTTFQMITSNTTITGGSIQIDGVDLIANEIEYRYRFGYCPQYDCLNNFMTAYESLKYMAKLRNVDSNKLDDEVQFWLEKLDLVKYTHTQIRHYSGGTKRKLNAAMAMIGSPSLVLLDEPTTGVDPVSRRFLWKCVQEFQKRKKTIVLTSHSMDECEQLCNRLAIMAEGRFKCIGSIPELKRSFGSGFTIKMKLTEAALGSPSSVSEITKHLRKQFPTCELRENHAGMLTYFIKNEGHLAWSKVFHGTEIFMQKAHNLIEDYSVNESTLEDIFLKFDSKNRNRLDTLPTPSVEEV